MENLTTFRSSPYPASGATSHLHHFAHSSADLGWPPSIFSSDVSFSTPSFLLSQSSTLVKLHFFFFFFFFGSSAAAASFFLVGGVGCKIVCFFFFFSKWHGGRSGWFIDASCGCVFCEVESSVLAPGVGCLQCGVMGNWCLLCYLGFLSVFDVCFLILMLLARYGLFNTAYICFFFFFGNKKSLVGIYWDKTFRIYIYMLVNCRFLLAIFGFILEFGLIFSAFKPTFKFPYVSM